MDNVKIIRVLDNAELADLEPDENILVQVVTTGELYQGNGSEMPKKIIQDSSPNYANYFMLMGA